MNPNNSIIGNLLGYYIPPSDVVHVGEVVEVKADPDVIFVVKPVVEDTEDLEQIHFQDTVKDAQIALSAVRKIIGN